jgi:hypothetical protein
MSCVYHQEFNAAKLAIMTAAPIFYNFTEDPVNFIMTRYSKYPDRMIGLLNRLYGMYHAVDTFLKSTNYPVASGPADQRYIDGIVKPIIRKRRTSDLWIQRRALLFALIQTLRVFGRGFWPGEGQGWW